MSLQEKESKGFLFLFLRWTKNILAGSIISLFFLGVFYVLDSPINKSFLDVYYVLLIISGSVIVLCALVVAIINGITKLKWGSDFGCKRFWDPIVSRLSKEYDLKVPEDIGKTFEMSPFSGIIILNKAYLTWRSVFWEFSSDCIPTNDDIQKIISEITIEQALFFTKKPIDEMEKRELVQKRVFAYKYEDFIFEMFSRGSIHYSDFYGWAVDSNYSIPYEDFRYAFENRFLVNTEEASTIITSLKDNSIIWYWSGQEGVKIGDVLLKYWNVVSLIDMNFNKYCRLHKVSKS
jgi:hypothetical protein